MAKLFSFIVGMLACHSLLATSDVAPTKKLTFLEAIQLAIAHSPELQVVRNKKVIRTLEVENSSSAFLPQLDLVTGYGLRDTNPSVSKNINTSDFSLQLSENIYDNGVRLANRDLAKLREEISELSFRDERDKLILAIASAYSKYSLAMALAEVQEQQFTIINRQYRNVTSQYEQGIKTQRDFLRFKTELRRSEIELQASQSNIQKARLELLNLIGFAPSEQGSHLEFLPLEINLKTIEQVPQKTPDLSKHFQYQIAALQRSVLEKDLDLARRQNGPELYFAAGANYQSSEYIGTGQSFSERASTSVSVLLSFKLKLLDWGIQRRNISIAALGKTQAELTIDSSLKSFESDNIKLMLDLEQSSKRFSLARELLELESKSFTYLDTDYRNGKVTYLEIITALSNLLNAKVQMFSSYFDLQSLILKYRYHEGSLYASLFEI